MVLDGIPVVIDVIDVDIDSDVTVVVVLLGLLFHPQCLLHLSRLLLFFLLHVIILLLLLLSPVASEMSTVE